MRHVWPAILALVVVLISSAGSTACTEPYDGPIKSFTAQKDKLTKGQSTKLTAVFDSGIGVIDNDVGEVQSGQVVDTAMLTKDTTYTLTVTDENGNPYEKKLEVKTFDPAKITSFKADKVVLPGQSTTMTPVFEGVKGTVDNGIGEVKSGASFSTGVLDKTRIYTLTVTNEADDPVTAMAEAEAAVTPVIMSFDAPGPAVGRFAPTMLTAVFTGGHGQIDLGVGDVTSGKAVATKEVPADGATWTLTVTNGLGEAVKKTLSVTTKKEMFATNYDGDVLVFDADATGDVPPKRKILTRTGKNQTSGITGLLGIVVTSDSVFLANENGLPSISVFGIGDREDTPPKQKLSGVSGWVAGTRGPYLFSMAGGELFVPDKSATISVWNATDMGGTAAKRTISGAATQLDNCFGTWVDSGELYVTNNANGGSATVTVYPQTASGNVAPTRSFPITEPVPSGVLVSGNELFVASQDAVTVFDKTTGAQLRQIKGASTKLAAQAVQCSIADGELFCASDLNDLVAVFPTNANGNVAPKRVVGGPMSGLTACGTVVVF